MNENRVPWCSGPAECLDCNHCWVAVWPLGADALECPKCSSSSNTDRDAWPETPVRGDVVTVKP